MKEEKVRNCDLAKTLLEQKNLRKEEDWGEQDQKVGEWEEGGAVPSHKESCKDQKDEEKAAATVRKARHSSRHIKLWIFQSDLASQDGLKLGAGACS